MLNGSKIVELEVLKCLLRNQVELLGLKKPGFGGGSENIEGLVDVGVDSDGSGLADSDHFSRECEIGFEIVPVL